MQPSRVFNLINHKCYSLATSTLLKSMQLSCFSLTYHRYYCLVAFSILRAIQLSFFVLAYFPLVLQLAPSTVHCCNRTVSGLLTPDVVALLLPPHYGYAPGLILLISLTFTFTWEPQTYPQYVLVQCPTNVAICVQMACKFVSAVLLQGATVYT